MDFHISNSGVGRHLLFSVRTRGILLRATIILCVIGLVLNLLLFRSNSETPEHQIFLLLILGGTALLQFLSVFRLKLMLGLMDLFLVLFQLGWMIFFINWTRTLGFIETSLQIPASIAVYGIVILLFLQCIWRIGATISTKCQNLWVPFDIQLGTPSVQRRRILYILAGAFVWRRLFRRESNVIRVLRGCFAIILLAIFIIFAYTNIIAYPLSEAGLGVRVKTFRTGYLESASTDPIGTPAWNIFVVVKMIPVYNLATLPPVHSDSTEVKQAVQVLPQHRTRPSCENSESGEPIFTLDASDYGFVWTFKFICPIINFDLPMSSFGRLFGDWHEDTLDVFVTVNFTSLEMSSMNFKNKYHLVNQTRTTVSIVAGLSNRTDDVISDSQAVTMLPNEHLISGVDAHIRQRFAKANAATFGLSSISKMRTSLVADLVGLRPNPSSTIPRDNNTGSLYLYRQPHLGDWTVVTDYREDSVLSGLSQVGGFWTLVNGILALVFGSRLVMIFFGVKPLSTFGLIHSFTRVDLGDSYPRIFSEGDLPESQRGLVAFMRDHMVDLDSIKRFDDVEPGGERDIEMEEHMIPSELPAGGASSMDSLSSTRLVSPHGHREMA